MKEKKERKKELTLNNSNVINRKNNKTERNKDINKRKQERKQG